MSVLGDLAVVVDVREVDAGVRLLVGLATLERDDESVEGRLGGAEVAEPPNVVRLVLSELGSGRVALELVPLRVVVLDDGRLFSSPNADAPSLLLVAVWREEEVAVGRAGALLMVLPAVREERVLGRAVVGEPGARAVVLSREDVADGFLASSAFNGGFAPAVVRLSMLVMVERVSWQTAPNVSRSGCCACADSSVCSWRVVRVDWRVLHVLQRCVRWSRGGC